MAERSVTGEFGPVFGLRGGMEALLVVGLFVGVLLLACLAHWGVKKVESKAGDQGPPRPSSEQATVGEPVPVAQTQAAGDQNSGPAIDAEALRRRYRRGYEVANAIRGVGILLMVGDLLLIVGVIAALIAMEPSNPAVVYVSLLVMFLISSAAFVTWMVAGFFEWMLMSNLDQAVLLAEHRGTTDRTL